MKLYYLNIAVLFIADIMMSSDAAILSNLMILEPTQTIRTSSSCQCKNICLVTPNCTYTSWIKKVRKNLFICHSTNKTYVDSKEVEGWNTYRKNDYCVAPNGEFIQQGSVFSTKEGCRQYTCVNSKFVIIPLEEYKYVPPNAFQYHDRLGCVHYSAEALTWTNAEDHCRKSYSVLLNVDTVEGVKHIQSYAAEIGIERGFWIAARRTTEGGSWKQNFEKDIHWNSKLWIEFQSSEGDSSGNCTKSSEINNFHLIEKICNIKLKFICQMEP